jgi:hypothetical protein
MRQPVQRYPREGDRTVIELGLTSAHQLFNSLDPAPFHEKDLDDDAVDYVVGAAREISSGAKLKLVLYLPQGHLSEFTAGYIEESIHNFFEYRRDMAARDLRHLFRMGRGAFAIAIGFLAVCVSLRQLALEFIGPPLDYMIAEGLLIAGWVAMWRPIQIFLYDWWPLRNTIRTYERLAEIPVEIRADFERPKRLP